MAAAHLSQLTGDRLFWAALAAGPAVCVLLAVLPTVAFAPGWPMSAGLTLFMLVLVYPPVEEFVFRGALQPILADTLPGGWGPLTWANGLTSLVFAGLHAFFHPPLWAAAVFVPSLVFGYFRERHAGLAAPIILHIAYNASYFGLLGAPQAGA